MELTYLSAEQAAAVDRELMGPLGFTLDQLMELAGLSVASALTAQYPPTTHPRVLVLAGPGNNGGDGLVAARHLALWGYTVRVAYPKPTPRPPFPGLVTQAQLSGVQMADAGGLGPDAAGWDADVVLDALFGFSFRGAPRPPFDALIDALSAPARASGAGNASSNPSPEALVASPRGRVVPHFPVVVSVDVPSGWDVDAGDPEARGLAPDMLVSLTAPKACARGFTGAHHYLGGRFVPPKLATQYGLALPAYPGAQQCVRVGGLPLEPESPHAPAPPAHSLGADVAGMRRNYAAGQLLEAGASLDDALAQFAAWFREAKACAAVGEPNAMTLATASTDGAPSARLMLLKGFDDGGFTFFTNYGSRKAQELEANPQAALLFYWEPLQRQVRVEGRLHRLPRAESEAYFHSRPRGSQLGAWASRQSQPLECRDVLERRVQDLERQFGTRGAASEACVDGEPTEKTNQPATQSPACSDLVPQVPYPEHWGGYCLVPLALEFWQGRPSRLHDRLLYTRDDEHAETWTRVRLQP